MPRTRKSKSPLFQARHYELIAHIMQQHIERADLAIENAVTYCNYTRAAVKVYQLDGSNALIKELARLFIQDNPKFSELKFWNAVYKHRSVAQ